MVEYEYKVVPAPSRGKRARGVKGPEGRFANAVQDVMNTLAAEGWEYLRSDTLPNDERTGLTSVQTTFRSILVFRRPVATISPAAETDTAPPPAPAQDQPFLPQIVASADPGHEDTEAPEMDNVLPMALLQRAQQLADDTPHKDDKTSDIAAQ
jgi:hypothetical protein